MGVEKKKKMQPDAGIPGILWKKIRTWGRRAKCKSLIKQVESQVITCKTKKQLKVKYSCSVIADLLEKEQDQKALDKAEQLYRDERRLDAYDQIMYFCELLANNVSYLCRQSSPEFLRCEVGEAVSSLIFFASNCGEVPQLDLMRNMFKDWYSRFESYQVNDLLGGNLVKPEIKQNLLIPSVPYDEKFKLLERIRKKGTRTQILGHKRKLNPSHEQIERTSSDQSLRSSAKGTSSGQSARSSAFRSSTRGTSLDQSIRSSARGTNSDQYVKSSAGGTSLGQSVRSSTGGTNSDQSVKSFAGGTSLGQSIRSSVGGTSSGQSVRSSAEGISSGQSVKSSAGRTSSDQSFKSSARQPTSRPDQISGNTHRLAHVHPKLPEVETCTSEMNDSKAKRAKHGDKK